jgi:hypothetical protein
VLELMTLLVLKSAGLYQINTALHSVCTQLHGQLTPNETSGIRRKGGVECFSLTL